METWFTSDTHFNHDNILHLGTGRPFKTIEEHNEFLIAAWNNRVKPGDRVYHLGDFAMGDRRLIPDIVKRLNGLITLVLGNHDRPRSCDGHFHDMVHSVSMVCDHGKILMRHAPNDLDPWSQGSRDLVRESPGGYDYYLHGHVHNRWTRRGKFVNVGVDVRDFEPKTLEELLADPGAGAFVDLNPDFPLVVEAPSFHQTA